jgi:methionyl-tRNA formyltransferase
MSSLSLMILCGRSPRHLYVANRLCAHARTVAIVQETGTRLSSRKILKQLRPDNLGRRSWRWLRDRLRYRGGGEAQFFFGDEPPKLAREDLRVEVPHINHPRVAALADRLQPDVIAVFGTSLIRLPLLGKGRLGVFNLHGGLSPRYRGADCTFWALYNGEPDQIGCTLHVVDAGIDTGSVIAQICPEVREGDDELTLFWRAVRDSADVYAELLGRLERGEHLGQPQREKGRLYQVKHRRWQDERLLAARMRQGLLHGVHLPPRVSWFVTLPSIERMRDPA